MNGKAGMVDETKEEQTINNSRFNSDGFVQTTYITKYLMAAPCPVPPWPVHRVDRTL